MNRDFLNRLKLLFDRLSLRRKLALAGVTAVALSGLVFLVVWANRPEFGLLYANLAPADASKVVESLRGSGVPYKLEDGGSTILVPTEYIYELRLKYAGQNLISSGTVGYELFDKNNFGLTDFLQKVNLKRALEGELSKTINQLEPVESSRVHLVIPERVLFEADEKPPTASVILKLHPRAVLERRQVLAIAQMVAGSVEGLAPENVTVLDTRGNMLTEALTDDPNLGLSNTQFELKRKVEKYLTQSAQKMLDSVLGQGNAVVKVAAELNFERVRRTSEQFDPDNTAILSEERNEERTTNPDTTLFQRENVISNYEINKVVEEFESSVGDIERLSVALFLNTPVGEDGQIAHRPPEELQRIADIVKHAVGFDPQRKDQIVVQEISFDRTFVEEERRQIEALQKRELIMEFVRVGLVAVGGLLLFLVLRSLLKRVGGPEQIAAQTEYLLGEGEQPALQLGEGEDLYAKKLSPEAKTKLLEQAKIANEVREFVEKEPEQATSLLRYWMLENEKD